MTCFRQPTVACGARALTRSAGYPSPTRTIQFGIGLFVADSGAPAAAATATEGAAKKSSAAEVGEDDGEKVAVATASEKAGEGNAATTMGVERAKRPAAAATSGQAKVTTAPAAALATADAAARQIGAAITQGPADEDTSDDARTAFCMAFRCFSRLYFCA